MATSAIANGHSVPHTEDIYDGIVECLENMLCLNCHELRQLKVLPCPENHLFCEDCLDRALIHRKCPSCMSTFLIPPGGVSGMATDVTHDKIKDVVLDSLCKLRSTSCPVCSLDENQAKLASKVYKYCREENQLVCQKCVDQCERDLELMAYNKVPESADKQPSAPAVIMAAKPKHSLKEVIENGYDTPDTEPHEKEPDQPKDQPKEDMKDQLKEAKPVEPKEEVQEKQEEPKEQPKEQSKDQPKEEVVVNGDDTVSTGSSVGTPEEDYPDAKPLHFPVSPTTSPSISASSSHEPIQTPPPPYGDSHPHEAPALPPKGPPPEDNDSVSTVDVPILHNKWSHLGSPLSRGNDVIFLPNDDSIIVADWYGGQVHRFSNTGEPTASKLLKHSPWSFVRERSKGPWSIAYSHSHDQIFVSEIGLASICRMSPKDLKVDKKRLKLEGVQNPAGLAFLCNGQLVLTEDTFRGRHRVAIYDLNGKMIRDWECDDPQLLCVDGHDRIIVSDHNNNRVEVYDTTGRIITSFGDSETLYHPMGVATDRYSNIYVTHEAKNGYALSLWSSDGRRVSTLQEWDHSHMTLTDREHWHMRSVDVHGDTLVLLGRRSLHGYSLKGF